MICPRGRRATPPSFRRGFWAASTRRDDSGRSSCFRWFLFLGSIFSLDLGWLGNEGVGGLRKGYGNTQTEWHLAHDKSFGGLWDRFSLCSGFGGSFRVLRCTFPLFFLFAFPLFFSFLFFSFQLYFFRFYIYPHVVSIRFSSSFLFVGPVGLARGHTGMGWVLFTGREAFFRVACLLGLQYHDDGLRNLTLETLLFSPFNLCSKVFRVREP